MNNMIRSVVFILSLICADIWNLLCLFQIIDFDRWRFSFAIVGVGSLTILIPQLMASIKGTAKSADSTAAASGKWKAGVLIGPLAILVLTWIACLVYPL